MQDLYDVHHHFLPAEYVKRMADRGIMGGDGVPFPRWSPELDLEVMDRNRIRKSFLSLSSPGVNFEDNDLANTLSHLVNDEAAKIVSKFPDRFGAFAVLPLPNIPASLTEAARALDELKLTGISLLSNYNGLYLGDPQFEDLMVELNRRATVVFVHPTSPFHFSVDLPYPPPIIEFPFETTRVAINLVFTGTLKKYPAIKFILSHAGGTIPYLAERIAASSLLLKNSAKKAPRGVGYYLKRLYYDVALSTDASVLRTLKDFVPLAHILYGSDFPYAPELLLQDFNSRLDSGTVFSEEEKALICQKNAQNMFTGER